MKEGIGHILDLTPIGEKLKEEKEEGNDLPWWPELVFLRKFRLNGGGTYWGIEIGVRPFTYEQRSSLHFTTSSHSFLLFLFLFCIYSKLCEVNFI